jgi:formylglycine-generating enzyme required for sulfatase activity
MVEEVLPVFIRVAKQLSIHQDPTLKPVLDPRLILISVEDIVIDAVPATPTQETQQLSGKYASFEQVSEPSGHLHRSESDVYIAGFIFYEILLGGRLFNLQFADFLHRDSDFRWLNWHCDPTKTAEPLDKLLPGISPRLSQMIEGMMQKDIAKRPSLASAASTFESVLKDIERERIAEAPTVKIKRKRSRARLKPLFVKAVRASIFAILVGSALGLSWQFWIKPQLSSLATREPNSDATAAGPSATAPGGESAPRAVNSDLPKEIDSGTGLMILIPETEFQMGSDEGLLNGDAGYENETPRHKVKVPAFYIDKHEVTNGFYKEFADETGRSYPPNPMWDDHYFDKPDYPVMNVSWSAAKAYATWAGKQLPTEAQWELAARGAEGNRYPWGNEFIESAANLTGSADGVRFTSPVGKFMTDKSPFGVMDMAGNVSEWVSDLYTLYAGNTGPLDSIERSYRVVRGAGMTFGREYARLTRRMSYDPEIKVAPHTAIGFRCVADVNTVKGASRKE